MYWPYQTFKIPPQLILDIPYFSRHPNTHTLKINSTKICVQSSWQFLFVSSVIIVAWKIRLAQCQTG